MAMGTRKQREKQEGLWIAHRELATAPGHPFYQKLNELIEAERFDELVEARCAKAQVKTLEVSTDIVRRIALWRWARASSGRSKRDCGCLLYTSPSPRDGLLSRMPSSA